MFVSYLIDPLAQSVTKVREGFDRAAILLGTDRLDLTTLWARPFDPDSSVDIVCADDAVIDKPLADALFRFRLTCGEETRDRSFVGKAVLVAVGDIPSEIARQVATSDAVLDAISFVSASTTDNEDRTAMGSVVPWNEHPKFASERAPARRASRGEHKHGKTAAKSQK
jgi:hypothetical protein